MIALHLLIRLLGQLSFEAEDQICHPGDNVTNSKLFSLKSKNIGKPTLNFKANFWPHVTTPISEMLFGLPKMPELGTTHCHPFTEDLTNLLIEEYNFSLMRIVSDVQIIDGNPWWCTDCRIPNRPEHFVKKLQPTHVCYPKHWTDGIGKFMCDLKHRDQIILGIEKELIWRCIPFEFRCRNINNYHYYMDFIALLLSFEILLLTLRLIVKRIEIFALNLPKPAPAA